jgi:hypothetical protein
VAAQLRSENGHRDAPARYLQQFGIVGVEFHRPHSLSLCAQPLLHHVFLGLRHSEDFSRFQAGERTEEFSIGTLFIVHKTKGARRDVKKMNARARRTVPLLKNQAYP